MNKKYLKVKISDLKDFPHNPKKHDVNLNDLEFKKCWALNNLRPLEKIANLKRPKNGKDIN